METLKTTRSKMNPEFYASNITYLKSFVGLTMVSAIQEEYYYNGKLDSESMGTLFLKFDNGKPYTFSCHGDSVSLLIGNDNFIDKAQFESECCEYKWRKKEFISFDRLKQLKKIRKVNIELLTMDNTTFQSGCRLDFDNKEFLSIWTVESDNIFYGLNMIPPYYAKNLKIELKEL